jgi:hypothetical protein
MFSHKFSRAAAVIGVVAAAVTVVALSGGGPVASAATSRIPARATAPRLPCWTASPAHAPNTATRPLYQALYDFNAEVVVTGHNHQYERFAPQNPTGGLDNARGIREFVAGMGGASHYSFGTIKPNSQARNSDTYGVLKLTLHANSYDWQFVPQAGKTYSDSGTTSCH